MAIAKPRTPNQTWPRLKDALLISCIHLLHIQDDNLFISVWIAELLRLLSLRIKISYNINRRRQMTMSPVHLPRWKAAILLTHKFSQATENVCCVNRAAVPFSPGPGSEARPQPSRWVSCEPQLAAQANSSPPKHGSELFGETHLSEPSSSMKLQQGAGLWLPVEVPDASISLQSCTGFRYSKLLDWLFRESLEEKTCSESPPGFSKVKPLLASIICKQKLLFQVYLQH